MTFDERVQAVAKKGFTERQARFLTTVMLHAGVGVPRQYARYCGIVHGAKTRKFFAKLVRLHCASMYDCRHNRARIYHVNQRALYAAIGEADSKLRRPLTLNHAIQRLMVLDAIVEDAEMIWLCVRRVHKVDDDPMFSYQAQHSPRKYTEAFVDWLVSKHAEDPKFFQHARELVRARTT